MATDRRTPLRYSLRMLLIVVTLIGLSMAVVALKHRQDVAREHAMDELAQMRLRSAIAAPVGGGTSFTLTSESSDFDDRQIDRLLDALALLTKPHDLGLSSGLKLTRLDLSQSGLTDEGEKKLREALPGVEISR